MAYLRQRGLTGYRHTGDWTWEFYPPPYDFLAPCDSVPVPAPVLYTPSRNGMAGCGCGCGGNCGTAGAAGLGLFDSGFDLSQWGVGEWAAVGVGVYLLASLTGDVRRAGRGTGKRQRRSRAASHRRAELERQLRDLG